MSSTLISRLNARFAGSIQDRESPDYLTRQIGGQWRDNQPYISGYFQVFFNLPEALFGSNASPANTWLHSTCESFTPHSQTINKVDVQGIGQTGASFVSSVSINREITMAFREYQNLPVLNVIRTWSSVFDPYTGVSTLPGGSRALTAKTFIPQNYKGVAYVLITKPTRSDGSPLDGKTNYDMQDVEEAYIYQGVFPTSVPIDTISSDITANDSAQLSVTFSFDGAPLTSAEDGVIEKVISLFNTMKYTDSFVKYHNIVGS